MERREAGGGLQGWSVCCPLPATSTEGPTRRGGRGKPTQIPTFKRQKLPSTKSVASSSDTYKAQKQCPENAARERGRVRTLRQAFLSLQAALPSVPPDTKLSKLDVLVLATSYIAHLTQTLDQDGQGPDSSQISRGPGYLHPIKKWPMRARLYGGGLGAEVHEGYAATND
ncbi:hypothetical protein XENTR_v10015219 [Xenopus tropicalis]|uniref:Transcription factor 23-like n=1 Tax=Xenopus tropicalis TaxID=8364 RepID=A0A1B8Y9K3_XENTR|nr:transcription factor 23-like [Xenopus tropicalis]KAE8605597.1 hypothetical protein XENTR_v10015219 [Xenopus tropicalis]